MSYSELLELETAEGVAVLTLNRASNRNALSAALRTDISDCLRALTGDPEVHAVVLTGAGEVFCAGFDLKELGQGDAAAIFAEAGKYHQVVHEFPKPLIAAVNGAAMAGGMDLALMCDVRLGCRETRFGQPQVRMGIPAAYELVRSVTDESTARYLCLTGNILAAEEALARGLVSGVAEDRGELMEVAMTCARGIADGGAGEGMKRSFLASQPALFS